MQIYILFHFVPPAFHILCCYAFLSFKKNVFPCITSEATELSSWDLETVHCLALHADGIPEPERSASISKTLKMHLSERVYCLLFFQVCGPKPVRFH